MSGLSNIDEWCSDAGEVDLEGLLGDAFLCADATSAAHTMSVLFPPRGPAIASGASHTSSSAPPMLGGLLLARDRYGASPFSGLPADFLSGAPAEGGAAAAGSAAAAPTPDASREQPPQHSEAAACRAPSVQAQEQPQRPPAAPFTAAAAPPLPAAHDEAAPPKRGRGRPPKTAGAYSKSYAAVREYRNRSKMRLSTLEQELSTKLEQMQLLTAENQALQAREVVLQAAINENDAALARELAEAAAADAPSAAFAQLVEVYREYVRRLRARVGPDGVLAPLAPWEERFPPGRLIMKLFMQLRPEEGIKLTQTNLETREITEFAPESWWQRVADGLTFSPEQAARMSAAMEIFRGAMDRLIDERRALQRQLADALARLQRGDAAGAEEGGGGGGDHSELLEALRANLVREDRVWTTTAWSLLLMGEEQQMGTASLLSWPYLPRMILICAAKFGYVR